MPTSNKTDLGNRPVVVIIGLIASIISIVIFFLGVQGVKDFFRAQDNSPTPNSGTHTHTPVPTYTALYTDTPFSLIPPTLTTPDLTNTPIPAQSQCNDGIDNDGDGFIDFPADPGCTNKGDNSETDYQTVDRQNTTQSNILGNIEVEYPIQLSPLTSETVFVYISIPSQLVNADIESLTRVPVSLAKLSPIEAIGKFKTNILLAERMRVELFSPSFQVESQYPTEQLVNLNKIESRTQWAWTIKAPQDTGKQVVIIRVYLLDDQAPSWVGSFDINVITPTPTPHPTNTPVPPLTRIGNQLVDNSAIVLGAILTFILGALTLYFQNRKKPTQKKKKR